jgi:hypothetical protein
MSKCLQCGRCCLTVGRTFWKGGNVVGCPSVAPDGVGRQFGDIKELNDLANNGDHEDNGLPCEMLVIEKGKAICKIHRDYGYDAKPLSCQEYPEDGELCFAEQVLIVPVSEA